MDRIVLDYQKKTNPMSLSPKMSERLSKKKKIEEKLLRSVPRILFFFWGGGLQILYKWTV